MRYSQETIDAALAYLDEGHTLCETAERFGVSFSAVGAWRRRRDGPLYRRRARSVQCDDEKVRLALGLAYGDHGLRLDEVAFMVGVAPPTISAWKRRFVESGIMDIPEIGPADIPHLSDEEMARMSREELERYVHELEVKAYVYGGTVKILKAEGIEELTNDEKAALVDARPKTVTVKEMLTALGLSSSSYYYCKEKPAPHDRYTEARKAIREEFALVKGKRGYRYIRQRLRAREEPIRLSGKTVRRLMAEEGCRVPYVKKAKRYSSYGGEVSEAPPNLVKRDFHAASPNALWLTDLTEFSIPAGKVYLSPVIDCLDGMPVAWTMGTSPNAELVNSMLDDACSRLEEGQAPVCHSDRGIHYRWPGWIERCERHGIVRSMSKKGCSPDNSAMEGFFGRLKNEFFYHEDWEGVTLEEFMDRLDGYMRYYRDERIKESLGWMSPMQYRKSLGLAA